LIQQIGTAGVAYGTLIPIILFYGIGQNLYLARSLDIPILTFLGQVVRASVPVMLSVYLTHLWIDTWWIIDSWASLAVKIGLLLVPIGGIGYFVVMNGAERQALRQRLAGKQGQDSV
jgi:peptidoglycan biosynthesis protein MviN/MurJ (putative lipid II flippase)